MKTKILLPIVLIFALLALAGCGTLNPAGPYQGDKALYDADLVIATSYDVIHGFVLWEYQNRVALATTPQIKQTADRLRSIAPQAFKTAITLRDAYAEAPNNTTLTALDKALAVIHALVREAATYSIQFNKPLPQ